MSNRTTACLLGQTLRIHLVKKELAVKLQEDAKIEVGSMACGLL